MRNNRIETNGFSNRHCALAPDFESMLLGRMRKIFLQQYLPEADTCTAPNNMHGLQRLTQSASLHVLLQNLLPQRRVGSRSDFGLARRLAPGGILLPRAVLSVSPNRGRGGVAMKHLGPAYLALAFVAMAAPGGPATFPPPPRRTTTQRSRLPATPGPPPHALRT